MKGSEPKVALKSKGAYAALFKDVAICLEQARGTSARAVNAVMTRTYWLVGRRLVEFEQNGRSRAQYGKDLLNRLASDLTLRFGRGFSRSNLQQMRLFYEAWPICQTLSGKSGKTEKCQTPSGGFLGEGTGADPTPDFQLPWSHYVRLMAVENFTARKFYEAEALRGGWSVRQLERQINTQFFERTALSKNKAGMLMQASKAKSGEEVPPEEELKDPFVLEFLGLKDEYSESDLEEALIRDLEDFLLELGDDFSFVGRLRRLRVGDEWYRVDLLFYHRGLRCLVVIDLKVGKFTHADAGQMHLYLNYAREHWTKPGERPPVGLVLCTHKDQAVAHYALEGLSNKILAAEYRTVLPGESIWAERIRKVQAKLGSGAQRGA